MGLLAGLLTGISAIGAAIVSTVSSIGSAIGGGIKALSSAIAGTLSKLEQFNPIKLLIDGIKSVVGFISEIFGLKEPNETVEEIAFKAETCEKKPEDFESNEEYIKYIREEVKLDKEKFDELSEEKRAAYAVVGSAILTKGMEEKINMAITPDFLYCVSKLGLSGQESYAYINAFKENGFRSMQGMSDYLKGNYSNIDVEKVSNTIEQVIQRDNPGMSEDDVQNKIRDMKINIRDAGSEQ